MYLWRRNKSASYLPSRTIRIKLTTANYCVAQNTQTIHKTNGHFLLHKNSYTSLHFKIALIVQSIELIPTKVLASLVIIILDNCYYNLRRLLLQFTTSITIHGRTWCHFLTYILSVLYGLFFPIFQDINIKIQYRSTFSLKEKHFNLPWLAFSSLHHISYLLHFADENRKLDILSFSNIPKKCFSNLPKVGFPVQSM